MARTVKSRVRAIERLLAQQEPKIARAFLRMVENMRSALTLGQVEDLLASGRVEEAFAVTLRAAPQLPAAYVASFVAAAEETAKFIGREIGQVFLDFDQTNDLAVAAMRQNRLRLVTGFTSQQREATRQALLDGIARGANPREQARAFRDAIGLTPNQESAVRNYRRMLEDGDRDALRRKLRDRRFDPTVRRAFNDDVPLSRSQVDKMVTRYRERFIKHRSEVIARTEALRSVHEGADAMFSQAFQDGTLDPSQVVQTWNTARDERVRSRHRPMHGQQRPVGEPFTDGEGAQLMFPGDPAAPAASTVQCRCVVARTLTDEAVSGSEFGAGVLPGTISTIVEG